MLFLKNLKISSKLLKRLDFSIILLVEIISLFGAANIYSATSQKYNYYFLNRQIMWILISSCVVYIILTIDYQSILRYVPYLYLFNVALLIYTYLFTSPINGARVWIKFGSIAIEPGEFAKLTITLILAKEIQEMHGEINNFRNLCILFFYTIIPVILIAIAPDMGLVLLIFFAVVAILFILKLNLKIMLSGLLVLIISIALAWNFNIIKEYQKQRITCFSSQDSGLDGSNFQLRQSKIAIGDGGIVGSGFKKGTLIQGDFIPESHTDFIFAVIANEWGFLACVVLLIAYGIVEFRIIKISKSSKDISGIVICIGMSATLMFSIFQNIGMTIGIAPISGITLPFISYGGSSILSNFISIALILNVGMRNQKINF